MSLTLITAAQVVQTISSFDAVIDARSPGEYGLDRLPGAANWPSLSDEERILVGTAHKQLSAFEARKMGAAMVARNVAKHIESNCQTLTKNWKPLIYCWRGGKRSHSLALILGQIGFDVHLIEGGYKAFRSDMLLDLAALATRFNYRVICGPTGSGKTRLLQALEQAGAQVLDLEKLAQHRSSVLGHEPGQEQPTQKQFDMRIWETLKGFSNPNQPVYVESESKKVGNVAIPDNLILAMRAGRCVRLEVPTASRIQLLLEDYPHFTNNPDFFSQRLEVLVPLRGKSVVQGWQSDIQQGKIANVVQELLAVHYDPSYMASMLRNFKQYDTAQVRILKAISHADFAKLAQDLLANP
jgi:tRNA 2-selenouridine synthase